MNLSAIGTMTNVADELSLSQRGITSATVIITGFVVVFAVLILLILIITIYGKIVYNAQNGSKKKKSEDRSIDAKAVSEVPAPSAQSAETETSLQSGVPEEVVAVISAAVASMYGSSGGARIKSIKKSDGGRSAWANAGVLNNTRPF